MLEIYIKNKKKTNFYMKSIDSNQNEMGFCLFLLLLLVATKQVHLNDFVFLFFFLFFVYLILLHYALLWQMIAKI